MLTSACGPRARVARTCCAARWCSRGEQHIDALTDLPLDKSATAGGSLELTRDTQVLGAPLPEPAHGPHADIALAGIPTEVGERLLERFKTRILRQPA